MQPLSSPQLLRVWEQGRGKPPYQRAMLLLAAACPDESLETLEKLSIGRRDDRLMTLREWIFGSELKSITVCPACGERLEFSLNVADIRVFEPESIPQLHHMEIGDYAIQFRLPNTEDLGAAGRCRDLEQMQRLMTERCICNAYYRGEQIEPNRLSPDVIDALASQVAKADPQSDSRLSLSCPACSHQWDTLFDIVSYFWSEVEAWAIRILREVHFLALSYGWREADILAMSPLRRRLYMEMIGQ